MDIFKATSFSAYLKTYLARQPKKGRGELSRMAQHLKVSSTLLSKVLSGERCLTAEQAQALTEYLNLTEPEAEYCHYLVVYERAGTAKLRQFWARKLSQIRERAQNVSARVEVDRVLSDPEKTVFYSSALYSAIRLFTSTSNTGKSLEEICARFQIARHKAVEILNFLVRQDLCRESKDRYQMGPQKTHLDSNSPHLVRHHTNWRVRAVQAAEELAPEEMMYTGLVSLSKADFQLLRGEWAQHVTEFLRRVHDSPAEDVACLNLDFFWVRK